MGSGATTFDLEIWFEGQPEPLLVRADQRDMAAFEVEHKVGFAKALDDMPMVLFRFLGWHAARRLGKVTPGTAKDAWLETVISVEPEGDEESVDPGQPAASAEPSST